MDIIEFKPRPLSQKEQMAAASRERPPSPYRKVWISSAWHAEVKAIDLFDMYSIPLPGSLYGT